MPVSVETELWGEFEQSVDDKGRIVLPLDLRAPLGDEFVITRGPDLAVWLMPKVEWDGIYRKIRPGAANPVEATILRQLHGGRAFVKTDAQFRLTVPKQFRDYANIDESHKAVLVGVGDKIELWNKDHWDTYSRSRFSSDAMHRAQETMLSDATVTFDQAVVSQAVQVEQ